MKRMLDFVDQTPVFYMATVEKRKPAGTSLWILYAI
jgi:uncharacterized pyridoxamine 5'-phosphate oxidase family protein